MNSETNRLSWVCAQAISDAGITNCRPDETGPVVRAILAALREPTEGMLNAARDWSLEKNGQGVGNDQATGCWQAMLNAALGPQA